MTSMEMAAGGIEPVNAEDCFGIGMAFPLARAWRVDLVQAHKWFNIAAMRGHKDAAQLRREIAEQMSEFRNRLCPTCRARLAQSPSASIGSGCRHPRRGLIAL